MSDRARGEQGVQQAMAMPEAATAIAAIPTARAALTVARRQMSKGQAGEAAREVATAIYQLSALHSALVRAHLTLLRQDQERTRQLADEQVCQLSGPHWEAWVQAYLRMQPSP